MAKKSKTKRKGRKRSTHLQKNHRNDCKGTLFRFLAFQPLSVSMEQVAPISLNIQKIPCVLTLRSVHSDASKHRSHGGTYIALDFYLEHETDLLRATQVGQNLIEDFLSAVALIEGTTFREIKPVQIVRSGKELNQYKFAYFIGLSMFHWETPIPNTTLGLVKKLLAHWDGLDSGLRLRRAARQFRKAIGAENDVLAFQYAYMGLEALEKPLATSIGLKPGCEEVSGKCDKCGAEYTRLKSVLAGVRAYVCGDIHSETATSERKEEWKSINKLRHALFHSLEDISKLEHSAAQVLPGAMHYLHDAVCCLSHAHSLESAEFKIVRRTQQPLLIGQFLAKDLGPLQQHAPLIDSGNTSWVEHSKHGFVPEFRIRNSGVKDLEVGTYWLKMPLGRASEDDLVPANVL